MDVPEAAANADGATDAASGLSDFSDLAVGAIAVSDTELGNSPQLACDPAGENLATLFLTKARTREITFGHKCNNVNNQLMLPQDGVDDYRNDASKIGLSADLCKDDH